VRPAPQGCPTAPPIAPAGGVALQPTVRPSSKYCVPAGHERSGLFALQLNAFPDLDPGTSIQPDGHGSAASAGWFAPGADCAAADTVNWTVWPGPQDSTPGSRFAMPAARIWYVPGFVYGIAGTMVVVLPT